MSYFCVNKLFCSVGYKVTYRVTCFQQTWFTDQVLEAGCKNGFPLNPAPLDIHSFMLLSTFSFRLFLKEATSEDGLHRPLW